MRKSFGRIMAVALAYCTFSAAGAAEDGGGDIVFSVLTWEGEFFSKDIPGGVDSTPTLGSLYIIAADGTGLKQVVQPGKGVNAPVGSRDGRWVYFQSKVSGRHQVYRCKPDGAEVANLTAGDRLGKEWKDAYGTQLSSDGSHMVYTVHNGSTGRVVLAKADGCEPRFVAPQLGYIYMAAVSPKADRVVFSGPAAGYRLMSAAADGQLLKLTPEHPESFVPRFSADGNTIIFFRRDGDVYAVGADGKDLRRLTTGNRYDGFRLSDKDLHGSSDGPDISPDGRRIAYIALKDGVANVHTMNADGSGQKQLTVRKSRCGRVRWSPDGTHLAFVSFEDNLPQLFVVAAAGGAPRQLTQVKGAVTFLDWLPRR